MHIVDLDSGGGSGYVIIELCVERVVQHGRDLEQFLHRVPVRTVQLLDVQLDLRFLKLYSATHTYTHIYTT